ncbi:MAG: hypothetical protein A2527_08550 [Candidatus Lambdaproteobacteria bacterium RIFOXYD2_FULL_50_16]|uniref:Heme chaperone HemW n=1 Tax=Candidatus Lambdaproteobacteria bacterium RIFOXYD2_FULL_50_16 TaxID=1817772 RepID=A0A1F6GAR8_9PROT|nr:MAG: hypothetical protein A2527_08550 [Candidatus Lambdaproteobacteria bacterium RIFOXYD2_FULL_50_16]
MSPLHSVYIHLPFCREICPFCGFAVLKDPGRGLDFYIDLLLVEWEGLNRQFELDCKPLRSIYLGGGTPSRHTPAQLKRLLTALGPLPPQVSIELNPEDVTPDYAQALAEVGFNRVSLGVQSFDNTCLKALGRVHFAEDVHKGIAALQKAGLNDFNLDFIFGYPGQSPQAFEADLAAFTQSAATHLSAYALSVEPGSKLGRKPAWGLWLNENEGLVAEQYLKVIEAFESSGRKQYEVSNFAKSGKESVQNLSNWGGENYIGLGLGAHGRIGDLRYSNWRRMQRYKAEAAIGPWEWSEIMGPEEMLAEAWMLGLRQPKGVAIQDFFKQPEAAARVLENLPQSGWFNLIEGRLKLTAGGFLLADELTSYLWTRQNLQEYL